MQARDRQQMRKTRIAHRPQHLLGYGAPVAGHQRRGNRAGIAADDRANTFRHRLAENGDPDRHCLPVGAAAMRRHEARCGNCKSHRTQALKPGQPWKIEGARGGRRWRRHDDRADGDTVARVDRVAVHPVCNADAARRISLREPGDDDLIEKNSLAVRACLNPQDPAVNGGRSDSLLQDGSANCKRAPLRGGKSRATRG